MNELQCLVIAEVQRETERENGKSEGDDLDIRE